MLEITSIGNYRHAFACACLTKNAAKIGITDEIHCWGKCFLLLIHEFPVVFKQQSSCDILFVKIVFRIYCLPVYLIVDTYSLHQMTSLFSFTSLEDTTASCFMQSYMLTSTLTVGWLWCTRNQWNVFYLLAMSMLIVSACSIPGQV